jgi:hypothetical protein
MGKQKKTSNALAVQLDETGKVKFDTLAKQGTNKNKVGEVPADLLYGRSTRFAI